MDGWMWSSRGRGGYRECMKGGGVKSLHPYGYLALLHSTGIGCSQVQEYLGCHCQNFQTRRTESVSSPGEIRHPLCFDGDEFSEPSALSWILQWNSTIGE